MIKRTIEAEIANQLGGKKAIIIKGARQVGKTTLIKQLLGEQGDVLWVNGDRSADRNRWNGIQPDQLRFLPEGKRYVVIDEAPRIENIGLAVKMMIDEEMGTQPILSGSSSWTWLPN